VIVIKRLVISLCLGVVLVGFFEGPASAGVDDIRLVLDQMRPDSMLVDIERLIAFDTRFMGSDSNWAAVSWIAGRFASMGYAPTLDSFEVNVDRQVQGQRYTISDLTQVNVIATRRGLIHPDKKIVLGAHYDSISLDLDDQGFAPGADDNATGVAAVLEMARLLRNADTDVTIEFVLFGAEELGLIGSGAYATRALEQGDEIVLMLGLDVLGTRSTTFSSAFSLDTTSRNLELAEQIADAAETFTEVFARDGSSNARVMVSASGCGCSDHHSFLTRGFPAIGVFQYFSNPSPHINMSTDTIVQVDVAYVSSITQAALAGTLQIAGFPRRSPDFDGSGIVDFTDFLAFSAAFGSDTLDPADEPFDLDVDGFVGFSDFLIFAESFGRDLSG
jgi:hypothetical protein